MNGAHVAEERDAAGARPDEQVELAVAVPVGTERPGVALDLQRLAAGQDGSVLAELVGLRRALVRDERDGAADLADDQVEVAVAVPVDRVNGRRRAGDPGLLPFGYLELLVVIDDELLAVLRLELRVAGDQEHAVPPVVANAAPDIDDVAIPVLDHLGRPEGAARTAAGTGTARPARSRR